MSEFHPAINTRLSLRVSEGVYRQVSKIRDASGVTVFRNSAPKRDFDKAVQSLKEKMLKTSPVNVVTIGMQTKDTAEQYVQLVRDNRLSVSDILAQEDDDDGSLPPF